jgi:hypothetical protein
MASRVDIEGLAPFINRLEKFDKDVSKQLKKEMRGAAGLIVAAAKMRVLKQPLSNWGAWIYSSDKRDLGFDVATVRRGYKVETNRSRNRGITTAFGYDVVQRSAAGAIFEYAGSVTTGSVFNRNLLKNNDRLIRGTQPRILARAYYDVIHEARARIQTSIQDAARKVGL